MNIYTLRKVIIYTIMILLFYLFQTSFFSHLQLADVSPNLLIILTASVAVIRGRTEGCLVGFFSGLLMDIMMGDYIGLYAFGFLLIGYFGGYGNRIFYKEDITIPLLIIALADLCYGSFMYVTGFLIRGRLHFLFYLKRIILPEAVYTVIVAIFLYRIILLVVDHLTVKGSENLIV